MKKILFLLLLSSFLLFPAKAFASDVVLNEIFANPQNENDEFVELFNKGSQDVVMTGWKLSDKVKTFTIPDTTIAPSHFYVLEKSATSIALNNSDEEVTLKDSSDQQVDSFSYSTTIEGKSWSRVPDGTGSFVDNTDPTKGSANSAPPTPTPKNTPTPTNAPDPTKTPTPTKAPTAAPTNSPTSVPTKAPTAAPVRKLDLTITVGPSPTDDPNSDLKLGSNIEDNPFKAGSPTKAEAQVLGLATTNMSWLFIALGLIFMAVCGILAYFQFGSKIFDLIRSKLKKKNSADL